MARTRLEGLKVKKVDFVDQGANPESDIALFKSRDEPKPPGKLTSFFRTIAKKLSLSDEDADAAAADLIEKAAETFNDKLQGDIEQRKGMEIWNLCCALYESICSILGDQDVADKRNMALQSLDQFREKAGAAIASWQSPESGDEDGVVKEDEPDDDKDEEEETDMQIDKSKLTPEEVAQLDAIMKKAGTPPEEESKPAVVAKKDEAAKAAPAALPPEVQAELDAMRKRFADLEDRELQGVAKKYEILGKKPDELVPVLKRLKSTDQAAYDQFIAVMDEGVSMIGKSGAFEERGRNGHGVNQPIEAINKRAEELVAADPKLNYYEAVNKAWRENPELLRQYEENR